MGRRSARRVKRFVSDNVCRISYAKRLYLRIATRNADTPRSRRIALRKGERLARERATDRGSVELLFDDCRKFLGVNDNAFLRRTGTITVCQTS
jgi:hypothetical protein